MVIALVGSRSFSDYHQFEKIVSQYPCTQIISGGARGADSLARRYAQERGIPLTEIVPNYKQYGNVATHIRNRDIVNRANKVLFFWDGASTGTKSSIEQAENSNKDHVIHYSDHLRNFSRKFLLGEPLSRKQTRSLYLPITSKTIQNKEFSYVKNSIMKSGRYGDVHGYVKGLFAPSLFQNFRGKDNIYVTVPSTTGRNFFPDFLAKELQTHFGGELFYRNHAIALHVEQSKSLKGLDRFSHQRQYSIIDARLNKEHCSGKNVVLVEDIITTGSSIDSMRQALYAKGIKVNSVVSLCQIEKRLASQRDFERITEKLYTSHPDKTLTESQKKHDIQKMLVTCFDGCLKHKMNIFERSISVINSNLKEKKEYAFTLLKEEDERIRRDGQNLLPVLLREWTMPGLDRQAMERAQAVSIQKRTTVACGENKGVSQNESSRQDAQLSFLAQHSQTTTSHNTRDIKKGKSQNSFHWETLISADKFDLYKQNKTEKVFGFIKHADKEYMSCAYIKGSDNKYHLIEKNRDVSQLKKSIEHNCKRLFQKSYNSSVDISINI